MMKWAVPVIILAAAIAAGTIRFVFSEKPPNRIHPMNRARYIKVRASSARTARLTEIKGKNIMLYAPPVWPRWIPGYAVDSSPLTQWAADKGAQWLEMNFSNRLAQTVKVSEINILWAEDRPGTCRIMSSEDGQKWSKAEEDEVKEDTTCFRFSPALSIAALRLEMETDSAAGVAIIEVEVLGEDPRKTPEPARVEGLKALTMGNDLVGLSWSLPERGDVYQFNVYRSEDKNFEPSPENLIAITDEFRHEDMGLEPDMTYYYRVSSKNFSGRESAYSGTAAAKTGKEPVFYRMPIRGVIEGFYNDPWPHQERLKMIAFMEDAHLNHYIYAPKVEPYHRQLWREPYPEDEIKNFKELLHACRAHHVTFNYGISPGLDIDYSDPQQVEKLKEKLKSLFDIGVRAFTLALDDIPGAKKADARMAIEQVKLVNEIHAWLMEMDPETILFFCPTVYSHTHSYWLKEKPDMAAYLEELANIDKRVLIFWTGPDEVFSETIDLASAQDMMRVWNRKLIIWDNFPVNDVGLKNNIIMGPYIGRDRELGQAVAGIFCNPMFLANASRVSLYTAGRYYTDPEYDPWRAYEEALRFVGGKQGYEPLKTLADTLLCHPKFPERGVDILPLQKAIDRFWKEIETGSGGAAEKELRDLFNSYIKNPAEIQAGLEDFQLVQELLPASEKLAIYGQAGIACLDLAGAKNKKEKRRLSKEIKSLRAEARDNPWRVADNSIGKLYSILYKTRDKDIVMEIFISKILKNY